MDSGLGFVQPMFFVGVVEDRNDPRAEGRVRVRAFGVHGSNQDIPTEDLPWATLIIGNHDVNFTPPPLNAWVFGFFIDGRDAQQPMILGLIPAQASELVDPATQGWGSVPAENYDRESQGARPRDLGLSPMSRLATGEFLNETYNEALETNRVRDIPIAGGCAAGHNAIGNGNAWSNDIGETADDPSSDARTLNLPPLSGNEDLNESRRLAENYIGREISDSEWDLLVRTTFAEATSNPAEQAGVMSVILNRVISPSYPNTISGVLFQRNQFQAVTGTRFDPNPSSAFTANRSQSQLNNLANGLNTYLPNFANEGWLNFTSNITAAYGSGTNIGFRDDVRNSINSSVIGGTVFGTVSGISPTGPVIPFAEQSVQGPQLLEDPSELSRLEKLNRANEIRTQIREKEAELEELINGPQPRTEETQERIEELQQEIAELRDQLIQLDDSSGPIEGTVNEPYSGYATPSADPACTTTWDEPPSGYSARYPYNRVIETASGHSIELDDSPGGERIMIWHRDGSYIQITGTSTTHKNMSDAYHVNDRSHHVYIGGNNIVTIEGDSHVLVKGDKIEEIEGNYKQIVHGNIQIGGARRIELNGADRTDIRSASLGIESNVENLNIRTGKHIYFDSGETIDMKSKSIRLGAQEDMNITGIKGLYLQSQEGSMHLKSEGSVYMNPEENLFLKANEGTVSVESAGAIRFNSTESSISFNSESTLNLKSKGEMLIGSESGSLNLLSADNMGIESKNMYIRGSQNVNIKADGGDANIGATGDVTFDSEGGDLFVQASNDVNVKGQNVKIEGESEFDLKSGGAGYVDAGAVLNLKAGSDARLSGANAHIRGSTVFIDDIVQLANGGANEDGGANEASEGTGADSGNEVETKQIIEPAQFDEAESGDNNEESPTTKATDATPPGSATGGPQPEGDAPKSDPSGQPTPPDPSSPDPKDMGNKISDGIIGDQGMEFAQDFGSASTGSLGVELGTPAVSSSDFLLLGISGAPGNQRALVQLPNGNIETLRSGEQIQGLSVQIQSTPIDSREDDIVTIGGNQIRRLGD